VKNRKALADILSQEFLKYDEAEIVPALKQANVPLGNVRNMKEVFEIKEAQELILEETFNDGRNTKRVKTFVGRVEE